MEVGLVHPVPNDMSRSDCVPENRLIEAVHLPNAWRNHRPARRSIDAPLSSPVEAGEIAPDSRRSGEIRASAASRTPALACRRDRAMSRSEPAVARPDDEG